MIPTFLILKEVLKDLAYVAGMVRQGMGKKYQNITQTDKNKLFNPISQDIINQCLENHRSVRQPEGHNKIPVMACRGIAMLKLLG